MYTFPHLARIAFTNVAVFLIIVATLCGVAVCQTEARGQVVATLSATDEAAIKAVAAGYFGAFSRKDLSGIAAFWKPKSTFWPDENKLALKAFADGENLGITTLFPKPATIENDLAKLRVTVEAGTDRKTSKPLKDFDSTNRILVLTKVSGAWLIQQDLTAEKDLALHLIAEKDQAERGKLLSADRSLINTQLALELRREAGRLFGTVPDSDVIAIWQLALAVSTEIGDKNQMARALDMIGYLLKGKDEKLATFQKGLAISDEIGDKRLAADILTDIAITYREIGEMELAWDYANKAKLAADASKDQEKIAKVFVQFGIMNDIQGNLVLAGENFENALAMLRESGDKSQVAGAINNTGLVYEELGNYSKAIVTFKDSIRLSEEIDDKYGLALSLMNLGNVYNDLGDYARAMDLFHRSIAVDRERGEDGAGAMINIGNVYKKEGLYDQAKIYLNTAFTSFEKAGSKGDLAEILGNIGEIERLQGNYRAAIENHLKALAINREMGDKPNIAGTLLQLGMIYSEQSDFAQAQTYFHEALKIAEEVAAPSPIFQVLLETSKMELRRGDYAAARTIAERARSFYERTGGSDRQWELFSTLGQANRGLGRAAQAMDYLEKAIAAVEDKRLMVAGGSDQRHILFSRMTSPYHQMAEILISQGQDDAGLVYVERAKARTLVDSLQTGRVELSKKLTNPEREREQSLKDALTSLNAQIAVVTQDEKPDLNKRSELEKALKQKRLEFEDIQVQLYAAHPELMVQRGEMTPLSVEEAATLLPDERSAIAEFVVAEDKTFLFLITRDVMQKTSMKVFGVDVKNTELGKRVEAYRSSLASGDLSFQKASRQLYDLLVKPAQAQLAGKTKLIIVPDGPLWDLQFQALLDEKNKYLAERAAVSYAPSLTALKEMSKKAKTRKTDAGMELVAFGNPIVAKSTAERVKRVFMGEKLEPLPESERLVNQLGKMYGPSRSKVFTGANAREETAKSESPKFRIVQFATHGILNNASPMYSHLVLAQNEKDPNEDGLLEAWEMKDLDLKADMVVLSACDTARGRISNGEGVIGMTWAMFIAGTPTTVASQWKVESTSTTELMLEFHRQLISGKVTKAEALRRAQLKLMKTPQFRHPSYWAGWVLVGDGS